MKTESSRQVAPEKVLDRVRQSFGADRAGLYGDDQFRVGTEKQRVVASPVSAEELAELLRMASTESWRVIPAGSGTWLGAGNPSTGFELIISTLRLNQVQEYEPADLTATVGAGLPLAAFNKLAGAHGQWIPLDPFGSPESTIGATISTGSYGPLRCGFGTPRDWLIGIQVAHIDGRLTRAGGKVVKNVAGYDLCKLYTGSYGTLAIITEMNFKLRSIPPAEKTLIFLAERIEELAMLAGRLQQAALQPAAMEIFTATGKVSIAAGCSAACCRRPASIASSSIRSARKMSVFSAGGIERSLK
ncbi:MAG: FAD-binding oxidoreductase, partial [Acidobacteriota bacterium]